MRIQFKNQRKTKCVKGNKRDKFMQGEKNESEMIIVA